MKTEKQRSNTADIARQAGVTRATVSYVLNDRQDLKISPETRERVLQSARELGYRHNQIARGLARGKTQMLGVLVPFLQEDYYKELLFGVLEACKTYDYQILLAYAEGEQDTHTEQVNRLLGHRVDGIVALSITPQAEHWLREIAAQNVPCIIVDDRSLSENADCVISADTEGMTLAVRHLQALGHQRIAYLNGDTFFSTGRDRLIGYREAMESGGLSISEEWILGQSYDQVEAAQNAARLLQFAKPPTAIIAANDHLAEAALDTAHHSGIRIPEEISVIGYGDIAIARPLRLSTVRQDTLQMSRAAVDRLFARMAQPKLLPTEIRVLPELILRGSTGAPPPR